jgi:thiosulfate/3-mercaptopyruvate sulfurtransferase
VILIHVCVYAAYEQMVENAKLDPSTSSKAELVLDARPYGRCVPTLLPLCDDQPLSPRFTGQDPEPRPSLSSGHMPHSRSLPFNTLIQKTEKGYTTVLPQDKLKQAFESAVGEEAKGRPIVAVSVLQNMKCLDLKRLSRAAGLE